MPVFNSELYLRDAVESVLGQSCADFELVALVDDRSSDASVRILESFGDNRIRVAKDGVPRGLSAALNFGIQTVGGLFIARMDSDDVCHSKRLERQIELMSADASIGICGTWARLFGDEAWDFKPSTGDREIKVDLLFGCTFVHPTVMFRAVLLKASGFFYDESLTATEDFDLWERAATKLKFANVGEVLFHYRKHATAATNRNEVRGRDIYRSILSRQLRRLVPDVSEDKCDFHFRLFTNGPVPGCDSAAAIKAWFRELSQGNKIFAKYDQKILDQHLNSRYQEFSNRLQEGLDTV